MSAVTSRTVRAASVAGLAVLALGLAVLALGPSGAATATRASHKEQCPKLTLALPADAIADAATATLRSAPTVYKDKDRHGMRATGAFLGSRYALAVCGRRIQQRTVTVTLEFPAERPSAALSHGVALVARFKSGYRVWFRFQ